MTTLGRLAVPDVPTGATVLVPLGSTEQHGPHLPLDTDARIATRLTAAVTGRRPQLLRAPPLPYGASGEHEGVAGTVSIGTAALAHVLVELGRSTCRWAARVLVVNGHGGNLDALTTAVPQLRAEGRDVAWWAPVVPGGDAHAGHTETSLLSHLAPELVHRDRLEVGETRPLPRLLPDLRHRGVLGVSPTGVLGDPTTATAGVGAELWATLLDHLCEALDAWCPTPTGALTVPVRERGRS